MKRIVGILWEKADSTWFYKDMCAYLYYLAKYYGWQAVLCYYPKGDLLLLVWKRQYAKPCGKMY